MHVQSTHSSARTASGASRAPLIVVGKATKRGNFLPAPEAAAGGPLPFNGRDVSLNLPVHGFRAKLMRDCGRCDIRGLDQARRVASLDLAAKWCALAVGNRGNARRVSPAARGQRGYLR